MMNEIQLANVDLNLLVLFDAVFQERQVGRAAKQLHLTPSAVSHGLKRLRQLLHDPLFIRSPTGVVATDRATELAQPISDVLARVRGVLASSDPFDPKTSKRRFTLGAPDHVCAMLVPALLAKVRAAAPHLDLSVRQLL